MAGITVNILLKNLSRLLDEDVKLISGVKCELKGLVNQVRRLNACLPYTLEQEKSLRPGILTVVYITEDVIDKLLVQRRRHNQKYLVIMNSHHRNKVKYVTMIIKNFIDDWMTEPPEREPLAALPSDRKSILLKNYIKASCQSLPVHDRPRPRSSKTLLVRSVDDMTTSYQPDRVHVLPRSRSLDFGNYMVMTEADIVGFDEEAKIVMKRLLKKSKDLEFVPIVGTVGLGKTTLAGKIFNDDRFRLKFFKCIWINAWPFKPKDICLSFLKWLVGGLSEDYEDMDVRELAKRICGHLSKWDRSLIVLDDVWTFEVVDLLKLILPKNNKGHRVLMTTCIRHVATYANEYPHYLKFLTPNESYQMLARRVFGMERFPGEFEELGKSIAGKCNGVPLCLEIVARALVCRKTTSGWKRVEENVLPHLMDRENSSSMYHIIKGICNHLTEEMKVCFLYFGLFPRGFDIPARKLIHLWIAECLIKHDSDPDSSSSLEERAEECLNNLVDRYLVMATKRRSDGQIKTCRLHDFLHDFCKLKAQKWLFQELSEEGNISETTRRLCIQSTVLSGFLSTKPFKEHVRSLYCFPSEQSQMGLPSTDMQLIPKAFPLLRILEIESLSFDFSKDFSQLFHLRYIAISGDFETLPKPFEKFWNLQTLILNTNTSRLTLEIKANIWKLLRLRHLYTNIPAKLPPPSPTGKDSYLQTLSVVTSESCEMIDFAKACYLKRLGIRGDLKFFFKSSYLSSLEEIGCLERLKLYHNGSNLVDEDPHDDDLHMGYKHKLSLWLRGDKNSLPSALRGNKHKLPLWFRGDKNSPAPALRRRKHKLPTSFKFLCTLKKLTLSKTMFDWSDASIIGQLESLEVLKLKDNAFAGKSWKAVSGGFTQLQVLWIERADFETWTASQLHFPRLRHLVLISCEDLTAVPYKLADIPTLQEMRLEKTRKAIKSAEEIARKKLESIKFKLTIFPPETD